jgi:mono/diheme cytochrome c family protein
MRVAAGLSLCLAIFCATAHAQTQRRGLVAQGEYIFALAGGCACHTKPKGVPNAGARRFPIPFGTVYSTNITQDDATGLGKWTDQQIHDALLSGIRPDGEYLVPVMPYSAYSGMAQEDVKALIAYLRTLKSVKQATPSLSSWTPFARSIGVPLWLKLFGRFSRSPVNAPQSGVERGRYLVQHIAVCGDCHTPKNVIGVPNRAFYLAGASAKIGPFGEAVANITPDQETGIGDWSREDIADLLLTGIKPDLDNVQGLMQEVIKGTSHGFKDIRRDDALAIADYLKSIPPIKNKIDQR